MRFKCGKFFSFSFKEFFKERMTKRLLKFEKIVNKVNQGGGYFFYPVLWPVRTSEGKCAWLEPVFRQCKYRAFEDPGDPLMIASPWLYRSDIYESEKYVLVETAVPEDAYRRYVFDTNPEMLAVILCIIRVTAIIFGLITIPSLLSLL